MPDHLLIVTDTTACIPQDRLNDSIVQVPVDLVINGKSYRDGIDITAQEFYRLLPKFQTPPHTSGSIPGAYFEAFRQAILKDYQILCLTEPPRFSGMYNSALLARQLLLDSYPSAQIEVLAGHTAAAGLGLVALAASQAAKEGKTLVEIHGYARRLMKKVHLYAALDTLGYLVKSGRVPRAAQLANILRIKPVFSLNGGQPRAVALPHNMENAIGVLRGLVNKKVRGDRCLHIAVMHAAALSLAEHLESELKNQFDCADIYITEFTPVIGAHTGPGLIGVAFYTGE